MAFMAHVNTNGNAKEIIDYYVEKLGAEIIYLSDYRTLIPSDSSPLNKDEYDNIANGTIKLEDHYLMFIDSPKFMNNQFQQGNNIGFTLILNDSIRLAQYYNTLKEDGLVVVPLGEFYWSEAYAIVIDKFGYSWQLIYSEDEAYL